MFYGNVTNVEGFGGFLFCFRRLTDTSPGEGLCTKGIFSYTRTLKMTRLKTRAVICGV